jgi:hypothetical protein
MKVNLQAARLWDVIESGDGDYRDDRTALAAIICAVPLEMPAGLVVKSTAIEAWEAFWQVRIGTDRVKEANAEQLQREFSDIAFKAGETGDGPNEDQGWVRIQLRDSSWWRERR